MKKLLFICIFIWLFSIPIFGQSFNFIPSIYTSFHDNGDFLIYALAGFWGTYFLNNFEGLICANAGVEYILGEWNIGNFLPIDYGIGLRFLYEKWIMIESTESNYSISPMLIFHNGIIGNIDFYYGMGFSFGYDYYKDIKYDFQIDISMLTGVILYFTKNFGLIAEFTFMNCIYRILPSSSQNIQDIPIFASSGYIINFGIGITVTI